MIEKPTSEQNSTLFDPNRLTVSTSSAPITSTTSESSSTTSSQIPITKNIADLTMSHRIYSTGDVTNASIESQSITETVTIKYVQIGIPKQLMLNSKTWSSSHPWIMDYDNSSLSESTDEKKSTRRLVVTACYILLVFLFFCGIGKWF